MGLNSRMDLITRLGAEGEHSTPSYNPNSSQTPREAIPVADDEGRVNTVLAGQPEDPEWESVHTSASNLLEQSRGKLYLLTETAEASLLGAIRHSQLEFHLAEGKTVRNSTLPQSVSYD